MIITRKIKAVTSAILALTLLIGMLSVGGVTVGAASSKTLALNGSLLSQVGAQPSGSITCSCYALAYARTILDGRAHSYSEYNEYGASQTSAWCQWSWGGYYSVSAGSRTAVFQACIDSINANTPIIIHVSGSTGQHWVTVVGYQNVTSAETMSESNLLIVDPGWGYSGGTPCTLTNGNASYSLNSSYCYVRTDYVPALGYDYPLEGQEITEDAFLFQGWVNNVNGVVSTVECVVNDKTVQDASLYSREDVPYATAFRAEVKSDNLHFGYNTIAVKVTYQNGTSEILGMRTVTKRFADAIDAPVQDTSFIFKEKIELYGWHLHETKGISNFYYTIQNDKLSTDTVVEMQPYQREDLPETAKAFSTDIASELFAEGENIIEIYVCYDDGKVHQVGVRKVFMTADIEDPYLTVTIETVEHAGTVAAGEEITLELTASAVEDITALDMRLCFDDTKLEFVSGEFKGTLGGFDIKSFNGSPAATETDGAEVWLTAAKTSGSAALNDCEVIASVTLRALTDITADEAVRAYRCEVTSQASLVGAYELAASWIDGGVTIVDYPRGDINRDGRVSLSDAMRAFYAVNGQILLDAEEVLLADVDGDGEVGIRDAMRIFYCVNGVIDSL